MKPHHGTPTTAKNTPHETAATTADHQNPATTQSDQDGGLRAVFARHEQTLLPGQIDREKLSTQRTFELRHRQQIRSRHPLNQTRHRRHLQTRPASHLIERQPLYRRTQTASELGQQLPTSRINTNPTTHPATTNP